MARETLDAQRQLIDPVWGGVYQYSTDGDWKHPHFEKIMQMQAENLRSYAQAYALWKDPAHLEAAKKIRGYLRDFLTSPDGAFYTSQDADLVQGEHSADYFALTDAERRKRGVPRIDRHIYARENGWAINALATLYGVTGDESALAEAMRAAEWIIANRSLAGWRLSARRARRRRTLSRRFHLHDAGVLEAVRGDRRSEMVATSGRGQRSLSKRNSRATSATSRLSQPLGREVETETAGGRKCRGCPDLESPSSLHRQEEATRRPRSTRCVISPRRRLARTTVIAVAGILLADQELGAPPLHVTVVGKKDDPAARLAFQQRRPRCRQTYKRVEWWDDREGAMPNPDVQYPTFDKAAAFICTNRRCSAPIFDPAKILTFTIKK